MLYKQAHCQWFCNLLKGKILPLPLDSPKKKSISSINNIFNFVVGVIVPFMSVMILIHWIQRRPQAQGHQVRFSWQCRV